MSEPRKINRSGASTSRNIRRPQDTQGRQTGQFEIPHTSRGTGAASGSASAAPHAAPNTGVRRPSQTSSQGTGARPSAGTRSGGQASPYGSRPATGTRPAGSSSVNGARPTSGTRSSSQSAARGSYTAASSRTTGTSGRSASHGTGRTGAHGASHARTTQSGGRGRRAKGGAVAARRGNIFFGVLTTLIIIMIIFYVAFRVIMGAIAPESGTVSISDIVTTPEEYQGDQLNVLVVGVDWDEERAYGTNDTNTNDGNTDMILYVHFDLKEHQLYMLQIPRNTLVAGVYNSGNYQINNVAMYNDGYASLADCIYKMFGLSVDRYVAIDMASFRKIVDAFNGVEVYVPQDIDDGQGSKLYAGYQTLYGEQAEFFVRNRHGEGYARSDLDRLNMQRYFYSALFRRLRSISVWEAVKMVPIAMEYVTTDLSASDIASLAVSFLKVDSSNIMICQLPSCNAEPYNSNSVLVTARQEAADLLNQYFRDYTGPVDASQLQLPDWPATSGASDPNVQFMNSLDSQAEQGQQDLNIDGSYNVITETPEETPAPEAQETQEPAA